MANIILTNQNRIIGLPVSYDELLAGEQVVATNAPNGMLFVSYEESIPKLNDYASLEIGEVPNGVALCLPCIESYKEKRKKELLGQIRQLESIDCQDKNETQTE